MSDASDYGWSPWRPFPDPRVGGILQAPIGPGVYELQQTPPDGSLVLIGMGLNVAARMSSLLPIPLGCGNRNAADKRSYVLVNLGTIHYRALACATKEQARAVERRMLDGGGYRFNR